MEYMTTHNNWDSNLLLPFAVSAFKGDEIYIDPIWGIRIHHVTADGEIIPGKPYDEDLDDLNFNKIAIGKHTFIYKVRFDSLFFAKTFGGGDYELELYTISQDAEHIVIQYQLRVSPESTGPTMTLESRII